jgi:hypothetical protein
MPVQIQIDHLIHFYDTLTLSELVIVRLLMYLVFIYGAWHITRALYHAEKPPSTSRISKRKKRKKRSRK